MGKYKTAVVFGWGAVEQTARKWSADAVCAEVEVRLWVVTSKGEVIGGIAKVMDGEYVSESYLATKLGQYTNADVRAAAQARLAAQAG
jgi:hypothetical protein